MIKTPVLEYFYNKFGETEVNFNKGKEKKPLI